MPAGSPSFILSPAKGSSSSRRCRPRSNSLWRGTFREPRKQGRTTFFLQNMKYKLIVFDWDGTVIDSPAAIVECMQEASRELGLPVPEAWRAGHGIGLGFDDAMEIVAPGLPGGRYPGVVAPLR